MAIYSDHYYCHVCHASGDVISLVRQLLNLDFAGACAVLVDDYGISTAPPSRGSRTRAVLAREAAAEQHRIIQRKRQRRDDALAEVAVLVDVLKSAEPLSDAWCWLTKRLEYCYYVIDDIGLEV